jgi:hypothetical protein
MLCITLRIRSMCIMYKEEAVEGCFFNTSPISYRTELCVIFMGRRLAFLRIYIFCVVCVRIYVFRWCVRENYFSTAAS